MQLAKNDEWGVKVVCEFYNHPAIKHLEGHSFANQLFDKNYNERYDNKYGQTKEHTYDHKTI